MAIRFSLRLAALTLVLAALVGAAALITYRLSLTMGYAELQSTGRHRLDVYSASLEREIVKYAYFPGTLTLERDVIALLRNDDGVLRNRVNGYLEALNERAGTLAVYVMDARGRVLASSNWRRPDSYVGEDLSFRAYFNDAMLTGSGRFFGIGTTRSEPGYYLSSSLAADGRTLGVAVIKVSLEQLEKSWATVEAPVLVADENGVVILSSVADWKFTTLRPLDESTRNAFDRTQQYNRRALQALGFRQTANLGNGARLVRMAREAEEMVSVYPVAGQFLAQSQPLSGSPWTLTVYSPLGQLNNLSAIRAVVGGISTVLLCILAVLIFQRRRHLKDHRAAQQALQAAHDELERKVAERTRDLSAANQRLHDEIGERVRAEQTLRDAQNELIQAGKLAVIGRLSTGIAHELNQPLAALRTLSGNAIRFLERGDLQTVRSNLERIAQLADRMGLITGQLKSFAHKSSGKAAAVDLRQVLANAVNLLEERVRTSGARIEMHLASGALEVWCDANRLQQVIVNLLGNALDAMAGNPAPRVDIAVTAGASLIRVEVRDHGPGLSEEAQARLFEPFFTTKEAGVGLGLGLAISSGIVADFAGRLSGGNHPDGGALFVIEIPRSKETIAA